MSIKDLAAAIQKIKELELSLVEKDRKLGHIRQEVVQLNSQLEKVISQISLQLKTAYHIQRVLVPTEFPTIPGFEFSTKFLASPISGGDYFDIFDLEDRFRFGIVVSCSSGYGMSALFLSVLLKLMGQFEARKGASPHEVLGMMMQELQTSISGEETSSVFYGIVDRRNFDLAFCRVGSVVGLHHQSVPNKISVLGDDIAPLAKNFNLELKSDVVNLNPRDRVIICSEGILQAANRKGEVYGLERLKRVLTENTRLSVHELRNEILYQTQRFTDGQTPKKDLTIVIAEVKDRVLKLAK